MCACGGTQQTAKTSAELAEEARTATETAARGDRRMLDAAVANSRG